MGKLTIGYCSNWLCDVPGSGERSLIGFQWSSTLFQTGCRSGVAHAKFAADQGLGTSQLFDEHCLLTEDGGYVDLNHLQRIIQTGGRSGIS
jgi:hypothetical protein